MAVHFVDYVSPLNPWKLKSEVDNPFSISLAGPESQKMNDNLQNVSMFLPYSLRSAQYCVYCSGFYISKIQLKRCCYLSPWVRHFFLCKIVAHAYIPWEKCHS